jgi:hypothetical protein
LEGASKHFTRELTEQELKDWAEFMALLPIGLLRSAFTEWNRTGLYFPKMAQIGELVEGFKTKATTDFRACEQDGCIDGWVRIFAGQTAGTKECGPKPIDPKLGAVKRCQCFWEWAGRAI